jgi:hypothetical protein
VADSAAVAREIMEYFLLQLRDAKPGSERNAAPPQLHTASGALFGLARAGLIDAASAQEWRDQIHEEAQRFLAVLEDESKHTAPLIAPQPPQVERATIEEVMNDQLARIEMEIQSAASQGRLIYPWNSRELALAQALVRALAELGILSELEERKWTQRLQRAVDLEAEPVRAAHALARSAVPVEARSAPPVGEADFPLVHPAPRCFQKELVDVLLIREASHEGVRLEFIELYTDGFVVNWSGPPIRHHPRSSTYIPRWRQTVRVTDDLGTYYFTGGGGGGGSSDERSRGTQVFAPAIPTQATELHVTLDDDGFVIKLPPETGA